ncbi:MAG: hypothetical protein NVSMB16_01460 [Acidimicrobiales bacterium]
MSVREKETAAPEGGPEAVRVPTVASTRAATALKAWGRYLAGMAALVVLLLVVKGNGYWLDIIILSLLFAGISVGWNIIGGFGGQLSLGHGVYFAIGAYSVGILYTRHSISPWIGMVVAIPIAVAVAGLTSWPTFRLRGPFFAMATLALNQVALVLATYFSGFTGGSHGISLTFKPSLANLAFTARWKYGIVMLVFVAITLAISLVVSRSRLGYALRAVREDDDAAAVAGFNVFAVKMRGMLISAAITTVGGGLFAAYIGYIDPDTVLSLPDVSVRIALFALLGGIGTVWGSVIGALVLLPAITQLQSSLAGNRPGISLVAVGLLLVLTPLLLRRGVIGTASAATARLRRGRAR